MARKQADKRKKREQRVKEKRRRQAARESPAAIARRGAAGEVYDCRLSEAYGEPGALVQMFLARRIPNDGRLATGVFLVDLACLGLKDGFVRCLTDADYHDTLDRLSYDPLVACSPAFARLVIETAIEYARTIGFKPHPDGMEAMALFGEIEAAGDASELHPGGPEGKPLFACGPHDNARRILAHLRDECGVDGFNYILPGEVADRIDLEAILGPR